MKSDKKGLWVTSFGLLIVGSILGTTLQAATDSKIEQLNATTQRITVPLPLSETEHIYKESLRVAADHPAVTITQWDSSTPAIRKYDPASGTPREMYESPVSVQFTAEAHKDSIVDAHAHISYQRQSDGTFQSKMVPLSFAADTPAAPAQTTSASTPDINTSTSSSQTAPAPEKSSTSWTEYISNLLKHSNSTWVQAILALLLGVLLSLTPCIYPMIPITAGVIQAQSGSSVGRNFTLSLSYTLGLSTTFALLGLAAAFAGQAIGALLTSPFFVLSSVAMLSYLAFSMLGFYELKLPALPGGSNVRGGSLLSCFALGAVSGTIASPCVSPGLILLLTVVTTMGSKMLGFFLLFFFGLGLSIPLLVIGTFSGSLNALPKAGAWMIEIKKIFGFMMLGMCFYFLAFILPQPLLMGGLAALAAGAGLFYLRDARLPGSCWKMLKNIIGMGSVAGSVVIVALALMTCFHTQKDGEDFWTHDYISAVTLAKSCGKKVFVDFSTPYCSLCRAIDKKLFSDPKVVAALKQLVPVKIDASDTGNSAHSELQKRLHVMGTPTCVVIDPNNGSERELCRWGGELYDMSPENFILALHKLDAC